MPLSSNEEALIRSTLAVKKFKKKDLLLAQHEISKEFFFILSGCVRMFYHVNGEEKTTFFYIENQFVSSYESFTQQKPSTHNLECIEDCELVIISQESAMVMLQSSKTFESLARMIMEEELATYQTIVASFITLSPEERYLDLMEKRPDLIQRIPQYHLATYLGVSAESLSRIKKRLADKVRS